MPATAAPDQEMSHRRRAFEEFGVSWHVVDGVSYRPSDLLRAGGHGTPLPGPLQRLVEAGDALEHRAVYGDLQAIEKQWHPLCGGWWVDRRSTSWLPSPGEPRWLIRHFEAAVKLLFTTVHEVVHAQVGYLGLLGLLGEASDADLMTFHQAGEGLAVLVGDLESHAFLSEDGYFDRLWPPARDASHAVGFDPLPALARAGLSTAAARADWMRGIYLGDGESLPDLPGERWARAMALGFLTEEHHYARKSTTLIQPAWLARYWSVPEIVGFRERFIPSFPVELRGERKVVVGQVEQLFGLWREATVDWGAAWYACHPYGRTRLAIQRAALKAAELLRAVRSPRFQASASVRARSEQHLVRWYQQLSERFEAFLAPDGERPAAQAAEVGRQVQGERRALANVLREICGGPVWTFSHPLLTDEELDDRRFRSLRDLPLSGPPPRCPPR